MTIKAAILGFGTVGQGIYKIIQSKRQQLYKLLGDEVELESVLVNDIQKERALPEKIVVTDRFEDILSQRPDVIFEATVGAEPSFSYLNQAIDQNIHIVTANKVMFAARGHELLQRASQNVGIGYEATTAAGIPIIGTLKTLLQTNQVTKVQGILNGTSNYILTAMQEEDKSFSEALHEAQVKGYAEADPTNDVEGHDAFYKLMILSQLLYSRQPVWSEVPLTGISHLGQKDLQAAKRRGEKIRHVASLEFVDGILKGRVEPLSLPSSHGLFSVEGVDNAIDVTGDLVGSVTLRGPGAGQIPTASAMIEDFVQIWQARSIRLQPSLL
ncbi:homoserine dehydrogenase [Halobacillus sp. A5]|uniref:homoserine dehydrogenase n=1 Tax=Halobacillus sp. A5 TaxID=2880263 RepID=UPI0020A63C8A|nr:homoserine dehydrogenase [Halobacillus sp. A5]MCP3027437.1 homoserine dehydrogenase [Halobacillus sp. A5]